MIYSAPITEIRTYVLDNNKKLVKINYVIVVSEKDDVSDKVELVICLGGDKSLLYASSLFLVRKKDKLN